MDAPDTADQEATTAPARRSGVRELLLCAVLFVLAWAALSAFAVKEHPDHTDEPEWVAISILHWRQLVLGEPPAGAELDPPETAGESRWKRGVQRTVFGYMNPCLPKLMWGGVLHAAGYGEASPLVFELFRRDQPQAGLEARAATEPAMPTARRVVQALAALCAVLLFLVGRELARGWIGWLIAASAMALFLASPLVLHTATYIRTDFFMLPFALGSLLLALRTREALAGLRGARLQALAGIALGLTCGLAVSSKLNGALVGFCIALWIAILVLARRASGPAPIRGALTALVLAGLVTCLVFYALNPRLWGEPLAGVQDILARWDRQLVVQSERAARMGVDPAEGLDEAATGFVQRLVKFDPWRSLTGLPGGPWLLASGLLLLAVRALRPRRSARGGEERRVAAMVLVFVLVFLLGIGLALPLHWGRFSLPTAPATALMQALCLAWLAQSSAGALARRRERMRCDAVR
jgi:4-amino-4-deoxy-L-arabinose transferase-like glycosyltransferase